MPPNVSAWKHSFIVCGFLMTVTLELTRGCGVSAQCRELLRCITSLGKDSDWTVEARGHCKVENV